MKVSIFFRFFFGGVARGAGAFAVSFRESFGLHLVLEFFLAAISMMDVFWGPKGQADFAKRDNPGIDHCPTGGYMLMAEPVPGTSFPPQYFS